MAFTVTRVNPLDHADELKALFTSNERPEFPGWFDRAYPAAVEQGASSWIARDEAGRVIVHIGCFPTQLSAKGRDLSGGLLVNLMADRRHRTFFPVVSTIRAAVRDREAA